MKLQPVESPQRNSGEPMVSLVFGVLAVGVGLAALLAFFLAHSHGPVGAKRFFTKEDVSYVERDSQGLVTYKRPATAVVPSAELLGMLSGGLSSALLGIYLSRRRRPHCRVTTCMVGIIVCAIAFFILWTMIVIASVTEASP
jgi:hypothetical protein